MLQIQIILKISIRYQEHIKVILQYAQYSVTPVGHSYRLCANWQQDLLLDSYPYTESARVRLAAPFFV